MAVMKSLNYQLIRLVLLGTLSIVTLFMIIGLTTPYLWGVKQAQNTSGGEDSSGSAVMQVGAHKICYKLVEGVPSSADGSQSTQWLCNPIPFSTSCVKKGKVLTPAGFVDLDMSVYGGNEDLCSKHYGGMVAGWLAFSFILCAVFVLCASFVVSKLTATITHIVSIGLQFAAMICLVVTFSLYGQLLDAAKKEGGTEADALGFHWGYSFALMMTSLCLVIVLMAVEVLACLFIRDGGETDADNGTGRTNARTTQLLDPGDGLKTDFVQWPIAEGKGGDEAPPPRPGTLSARGSTAGSTAGGGVPPREETSQSVFTPYDG
uniref:Uncharacterized protein n=1 Tax=Chromera velia CCMP2878 TaxID=1169474 RepID=A0A0G4HS25_9ALVE|eukprot:Cvel_1310.t1-p1 / transcript=Cvel_1310.t1 / gene=Cvel_1310 / organism=Chromera_velia_CCMP2878 / gene_product=hypothetical protein / transcript_product=hypothetical protein / location=Cvel_scaffold44:115021-116748(-) / protein_length=318 / sequence_SO=supercontig / SO=protein_coding / is_pseudo=false